MASPKGGVSPLDPASVEMFKADKAAMSFFDSKKSLWEKTAPLKDFVGRSGEFDAIFYPGGHGPMFDLVDDADSIALIKEFHDAGKPVASVCHGPAVLLNVPGVLEGRTVTGFSNAEEDIVELSSLMPFMLETELGRKGATFVKADEPWGEKVVVSGQIITGQNPASAKGVGEALAKSLGV